MKPCESRSVDITLACGSPSAIVRCRSIMGCCTFSAKAGAAEMQNAAASAANHRTIQDAHGQRRGRVFTCIICPTGLLRAVTQVLNPQGPRIACESGHNYSFGTQLA